MATEQGIVIQTDRTTARVKTTPTEACAACSARNSCHGTGDQEREVDVVNPVGARVDDRVVIYFGTAPLLKAAFLLYLFPVVCMLAGALIGHRSALSLGAEPSVSSAVFGFACLLLAFVFVRKKGRKLAERADYQPKIIRILGSIEK